jgi:hypothetical protein
MGGLCLHANCAYHALSFQSLVLAMFLLQEVVCMLMYGILQSRQVR